MTRRDVRYSTHSTNWTVIQPTMNNNQRLPLNWHNTSKIKKIKQQYQSKLYPAHICYEYCQECNLSPKYRHMYTHIFRKNNNWFLFQFQQLFGFQTFIELSQHYSNFLFIFNSIQCRKHNAISLNAHIDFHRINRNSWKATNRNKKK